MTATGLLVGTFPPRRCGIATYNAQLSTAEGWIPFVASPESPVSRRIPAFLRAASRVDRIRISFDPYALACGSFQAIWTFALLLAAGATRFEILVHEPWPERPYRLGLANVLYRAFCRRASWVLHVPSQRESLTRRFGSELRTILTDHGAHFRKVYDGDRATARRELGIGDQEIWLGIGFVTAAKGFSCFAKAFLEHDRDNALVVVVGTVRTAIAADLAEAGRLREIAAASGGRAEFRDGFVDDEDFDRWIAAADVVVLPYLETSTSGVVERARLFEKTVLARDLPGLRDVLAQNPRAVLYREGDLTEAMGRAASLSAGTTA